MTVTSYKNSTENKKDQVRQMFNKIAPKYDLLNHLLSFGIDKKWRKKVKHLLNSYRKTNTDIPYKILDIATGTGDLALELISIPNVLIEGIDISEEMILFGKKKICKRNLTKYINLSFGDAENIPFPENTFNAVTVAFGVRNFNFLQVGLNEINRVLKENGICIILEFSKPGNYIIKSLYWVYFKRILPIIGKIISKDKSAYYYLPESVFNFPEKEEFISYLKVAGFKEINYFRLTGGIVTIYTAKK